MGTADQFDEAELEGALRRLGYAGFRPGQKDAVQTLLARRRLLLVAPTGGGKSLCYQLPATLLPGTSVVISPLIALMHDQVHALEQRGVPATFLASTLESAEIKRRMARLAEGQFKIVYAAPERLAYEGFRGILRALTVPLIAVDEAHCISEWGHDFRPEYMKIGELLAAFPDARALACTATATPVVRDEILSRLGLGPDIPQIVQGFARPNLRLRVRDVVSGRERQAEVDRLLATALGQPGGDRGTAIVYAPTRKSTEEEAGRLATAGWRARAYHAGLDSSARQAVQSEFMAGQVEVTVATNAFGMGIDRADVRAVIHLSPPGSVEAYYQEVGRAGRDGGDALALMLTSPNDMPLRRSLLERAGPDGERPPRAVVEHKWNLYLELMRYAEGGSCRHDAILRYFGDEGETLAGCGHCDVCESLARADGEASQAAVQLIVRKALSGVARTHGRFGLKAVVQLLRGASDDRLQRAGLDKVSTYGVLSQHNEAWLMALLRRCVTAGWVDFSGGDRPVVLLTPAGREVMADRVQARLLLPPERTAVAISGAGGSRRGAAAPPDGALVGEAAVLFEALRRHRLEVAQAAKVPPYVVASDRTLRDVARMRPHNLSQLQAAHGMGPQKAERFGAGFLRVVAGG